MTRFAVPFPATLPEGYRWFADEPTLPEKAEHCRGIVLRHGNVA